MINNHMSKFLDVLEEYDPANEDKIDALLKVKMFLNEKKIPFTSNGKKIILNIDDTEIALEAVKPYKLNIDKAADEVIDSYDQLPFYKKVTPSNRAKGVLKKTKEEGDKKIIPKLTSYMKKRNEESLKAVDQATQNLKATISR